MRRRWGAATFGVVCTLPALSILALVIVVPLARTLLMSVQHYVLTEPAVMGQWAGAQNYRAALADTRFLLSVGRAALFTAGVLAGQLILGLSAALLLHLPLRGQRLWRTLILLPWLLPQAQLVLLAIYMLQPEYGVVNWLLDTPGKVWLNSMSWALPSLIFINIYRGFPFMALMFLAGLQAIPVEILEAARVDGANGLQRFRYVTLPHLREVLLVVLLTGFIWYMPHFMTIWTLTQGGPADRTYTLALAIYQTAFKSYDFGVASAQGVLWLGVTLVVCGLLFKHGRRT